jgi:hypothetical protein
MRSIYAFLLCAAFAVPAFAQDQTQQQTQDRNQQSQQWMVRFVHAVPDAQAVTVTVDGQPLFQNIEYQQATPFQPLPSKNAEVAIIAADQSTTIAEDVDVKISDGGQSVIVASGSAAGDNKVKVNSYELPRPQGGNGAIMFVHAVSDAPDVDVVIDNEVGIEGLGFDKAKAKADVRPGERQVAIRADNRNVLGPFPVTIEAGKTVLVVGFGTTETSDKYELTQKVFTDTGEAAGGGQQGLQRQQGEQSQPGQQMSGTAGQAPPPSPTPSPSPWPSPSPTASPTPPPPPTPTATPVM